ncbi:MAG TPA: PaaI family thioesterase [Candidatus Competibacteraceae bacterium]|nr:PaaI family thioesterase [Candidatus Competibacteraceae bacterium]
MKLQHARISVAEFEQLAREQLPFAVQMGIRMDRIEPGRVLGRAIYSPDFLRPGGTVSGPVQMALADAVMYAVVLSLIGRVELAVTTNLTCNFLRRPKPADLIADGRILKLGKRLAVGEVLLYSEGEAEPVAHVTATYSIPPHPPVG